MAPRWNKNGKREEQGLLPFSTCAYQPKTVWFWLDLECFPTLWDAGNPCLVLVKAL